jgi:hypothetical protein
MKTMTLYLLLFSMCNVLIAQDFKTLAAKEIEAENFANAVRYLEQAVTLNPNDAEAWYRLGHCLHWLSYDSVPIPGYDQRASDRILNCMQKALSLDPRLRNCYSVIGSEYGMRAELQLQSGKRAGFIRQLRLARNAGGYPDWLLEYARNILNSCGPDAILFTGGDAEVFPIWYCQFIDNVRTDVTLAPVPLLDRPWFILTLKSGLDSSIRPAAMPWTREQIMDLHVSKWTAQALDLPVPLEVLRRFGVNDSTFQWVLPADLQRDDRNLLSINRIVTLGLLRANNWQRPVHFSLGCHSWMLSNLNDHLQFHGFTYELVPFSIKDKGRKVSIETTTRFLMSPDNFRQLTTLKDQDIPYISGPLKNYRLVYWHTCDSLLRSGDLKSARLVFEAMETNVPASALPMSEGEKTAFDEMRTKIKASTR